MTLSMPVDCGVVDPLYWGRLHWPSVRFYNKQQEIIYSVAHDNETYVVAGNKLGKDFVAAFIVLWFFCTRRPCRVVTTSSRDEHLDVLWGEIARFIAESEFALDSRQGGNLLLTHHHIRWISRGRECPISYIKGMVSNKVSLTAMQGHHVTAGLSLNGWIEASDVPRTLFVGDEASGLPHEYYAMASGWASRMLVFGNPWPCDNFFRRAIKGDPVMNDKGGDILKGAVAYNG